MIVGGAHYINSSSVLPKKKHKEHRALLSTLRFLIKTSGLDMCLITTMNLNVTTGVLTQFVDSFHKEACLFLYLIAGMWEGIRRMKSLLVWSSLDKLGPCTSLSYLENVKICHIIFLCCFAAVMFSSTFWTAAVQFLLSIQCAWIALSSLCDIQEAAMSCNKNRNNPKSEYSLYVHNVFSKPCCAFPFKFFSFSSGKRLFGTSKVVERRL